MNSVLSWISIVLGVAGIWLGIKRIDLNRYWKATLSILDLALLAWSVASLRWTGLSLFVVANLISLFVWSIWLAATQEDTLTRAAMQTDTDVKTLRALQSDLRKEHKVFRQLMPRQQAKLILYLAQRDRTVLEIERMAIPVSMLWVIYRPDVELSRLATDFDRILRLRKMPATYSMKLADAIVAREMESPESYQEVIGRMLSSNGTG